MATHVQTGVFYCPLDRFVPVTNSLKNVLNTDAKNAFNSLPTTHEMWVKFVAVLHTADANAEPGLKGQNENKKVILTNGISHRKKEKLKNTGHIHRMSNYP